MPLSAVVYGHLSLAALMTSCGGKLCWDCWTRWSLRTPRIPILPQRQAFASHDNQYCCSEPLECEYLLAVSGLQTVHEWACAYVKYVAIFKKLERAHDQTIHPQKRIDLKTALEACMGRVLEVKHYLVRCSVSVNAD